MALSLTSQEPSPQTAICLDAERTLCLSCSIGDERATCTLTFGADTYDAVFALTEVTNARPAPRGTAPPAAGPCA